jgi:hypothetical protein
MNHDSLIRDPLVQLNLLLWMAKEQPHEAFVVRPLYQELGFRLIYIEHPFKFPMHGCLDTLSQQLSDEGLEPGPHSTHGLSVADRELRYSWDEAFKRHVMVEDDAAVVMHDLQEDTDPTPLLLVYSAEDYPDREKQDLLRQSLIDQVHALLLSELHRLVPGAAYECNADLLLHELTDGVFDFLGRRRQKGMRDLVRQNVLRRIQEYCKDRFEDIVTLTGGVLRITFPNQDRKASFLDWFEDAKRTAFAAKKPRQESLPLFQDLDED